MIFVCDVRIWNKLVGSVLWDENRRVCLFEFDPSFYQYNLDLAPIKMPLLSSRAVVYSFDSLNKSTFQGLPGLLADALPDQFGNQIINAWLEKNNRIPNSLNPVEKLCFMGNRSMGALEFFPSSYNVDSSANKIEMEDLISITSEILSGRINFKSNLSEADNRSLQNIISIGTSPGGARAKAVIAYNSNTKEILNGQISIPSGFSHYLIKFDGIKDSQSGIISGYGRVEMAYYLMAKDAGIQMTECRLLEEGDRAHFMTRRFDRTDTNEKLHSQTFCAMQHYDNKELLAYSYESLFSTMRLLRLPHDQISQMYRRMIFNVLSKNCDDHTKNFSFLMDKTGKWKISPAYDICYSYSPESLWVSQHCLSINGKRKDFSRDDFIKIAKQLDIKNPGFIIDEISSVVMNWVKYSALCNVDKPMSNAITKQIDDVFKR